MITSKQCKSVTDLRKRTKDILIEAQTSHQYIFSNNEPTAVLVGVDDYERSNLNEGWTINLEKEGIEQEEIIAYLEKLVGKNG